MKMGRSKGKETSEQGKNKSNKRRTAENAQPSPIPLFKPPRDLFLGPADAGVYTRGKISWAVLRIIIGTRVNKDRSAF